MGDFRKLLPAIVIGVMGSTGIYLIPLLLGAMVTDRGFTEQQAGWMASVDLGGYALTTFVTALLLNRCNWRTMALVGVAIMLLANLASTVVYQPSTFAAVRFLSGLGAGILAAIANVSLGQTRNPDRGYGLLLSGSLLFGTAGLWGLPLLLERYGLNAAYCFIGVLALAVATVVPGLPARGLIATDHSTGPRTFRNWVAPGVVLLSVAVFWTEQNAVYAYLERIGSASQLAPGFIGFSLGAANLTGFVGAALVAWFGSRFGRFVPLLASTLAQLVCLWALAGHVATSAYLLASGGIALAWNLANPIQLGMLAAVDLDGRALAMSATVIGAGLSLGPAVGAGLVADGHYDRLLWAAAGLALASFLLMVPALSRRAPVAAGSAD